MNYFIKPAEGNKGKNEVGAVRRFTALAMLNKINDLREVFKKTNKTAQYLGISLIRAKIKRCKGDIRPLKNCTVFGRPFRVVYYGIKNFPYLIKLICFEWYQKFSSIPYKTYML